MDLDIDRIVDHAVVWAVSKEGDTEYALHCLAFVEDAYERSNGIEIFGGDCASESAQIYEAYRNKSEPPKGAFAFYDATGMIHGEMKNWGHVALCIGNNQVVHAWDKVRIEDYLLENICPSPGWSKPVFVGWAPRERVLKGCRQKQWVDCDGDDLCGS